MIYSLKKYGCYFKTLRCNNCGLKENCTFISLFGQEFNFTTDEKKKFNIFSPDFYKKEFYNGDSVSIIINLFGREVKNCLKIISCLYPQENTEGLGFKTELGYSGKFFPIKGYMRNYNNFDFFNEPFLEEEHFTDITRFKSEFQKIYSILNRKFSNILKENRDKNHILIVETNSPYRMKLDKKRDLFQNIFLDIFKKLLYYSEISKENHIDFQINLLKELTNIDYKILQFKKQNIKFYWYSLSKRSINWIWTSKIKLILSGSFTSNILAILKFGELVGLGRMNSFGLGNLSIKLIRNFEREKF
ncbi:MAG: hypothetical protein ACTSPQ_10315 [Candidatus Helarchaeota archaeon]